MTVLCSVTSNELAALKRAQLWFAYNRALPKECRVKMICDIDTILCCILYTAGPVLEPVLIEAYVSVVDNPKLSRDDYGPLMSLSAVLKNQVLKAQVRSLGLRAMAL